MNSSILETRSAVTIVSVAVFLMVSPANAKASGALRSGVLIDPAAGMNGDIEAIADGGALTTIGSWIREAGDTPTFLDSVAWGGTGFPGSAVVSFDGGESGGSGLYYNTGFDIQGYDTLELSILAAWRNAWWVDDATAAYAIGVIDGSGAFWPLAQTTYAPGDPGPYSRDQIFHRSPVLSYDVSPTDSGTVAVFINQAIRIGTPTLIQETGGSPPHDDNIIDAGRSSIDGVSLIGVLAESPPPPPALLTPADEADRVVVSADLDWLDTAGADSYEVRFGDSSPPPVVGQTSDSSWPLDDLQPATTYYWRIAAANAYGATDSNIRSFTTRPAAAANAPNILLLFADDLGWCDLSTGRTNFGNGSTYIQTPNVDRLADQGLCFTNAYVYQNCVPSRASLMTGQWAERSNIYTYGSTMRDVSDDTLLVGAPDGENISTGAVTFAEQLQAAGYTTIHIGKFHVADNSAQVTAEHGFDICLSASPPVDGHPGDYFASETAPGTWEFNNPRVDPNMDVYAAPYTQAYIDAHLRPYANGSDPDALVGTPKHLSDAMADAAVDVLSEQIATGRPFFMNLAFNAIHTPIESRSDLQTKYAGITSSDPRHSDDAYAGLTEGMDQAMGRVLDFLEDPNGDGDTADSVADNTVVIFISDNGPWPGASSAVPLAGVKSYMTEGGVRVPMIVRYPGHTPTGASTTELVHIADFYPTLLELAGGVLPNAADHTVDGESFAPVLLDQPAAPRERTIFYHFPGYFTSQVTPVSAAIRNDGTEVYKLYYYYEDQRYALYNLTTDLGETNDLLAGSLAPPDYQIAVEMSEELCDHLYAYQPAYPTVRATGETVPPPTPLGGSSGPDCNSNGIVDALDAVIHGDWNADGAFDMSDLEAAPEILGGPGQIPTGDADCAHLQSRAFDLDGDNDVDLRDFALLTGALWGDAFASPHDYLSNGVNATGWDGLLNANNATVFNAAIDVDGCLTIESSGTFWRNNEITGPLLYRTVAGDFDAIARFAELSEVDYHTAFIGARDPDLGADGKEDWLYIGQQNRSGSNDFAQFRRGDDGAQVTSSASGAFSFVRLIRQGDNFSAYASPNGVSWIQVGPTEARPDLPTQLQVGIGHGSFGGSTAVAAFESFSLVQP